MERLGIMWYGTRDIELVGLPEVISRCFARLNPQGDRSLHVSFDIDVLDPVWAPSTGTPGMFRLCLDIKHCILK